MTRDADGIKDQNWAGFDPGSTIVTADGEEFGSVREKTPHYLILRAHKNALEEVEMYIPREFVTRVEGDRVVLAHSAAQLRELDLTKPPAVRAESGT
jgi:hypothetical protein